MLNVRLCCSEINEWPGGTGWSCGDLTSHFESLQNLTVFNITCWLLLIQVKYQWGSFWVLRLTGTSRTDTAILKIWLLVPILAIWNTDLVRRTNTDDRGCTLHLPASWDGVGWRFTATPHLLLCNLLSLSEVQEFCLLPFDSWESEIRRKANHNIFHTRIYISTGCVF